jgi:hypothetical protein
VVNELAAAAAILAAATAAGVVSLWAAAVAGILCWHLGNRLIDAITLEQRRRAEEKRQARIGRTLLLAMTWPTTPTKENHQA